jgi:quercetin dioxygenase-like cupin family protein
MINIKGEYPVNDRWPLNLIKLEANTARKFSPQGTDYVLLRNAGFVNPHVEYKSVNGAICTASSYNVVCGENSSAVIIQYPGLKLLEDRFYVQRVLSQGNLSYMDGGTNTTAVNPGRLGDPVVNYVHFPAGMQQTLHTHPSHRIGLVLKGRGVVELDKEDFALEEGDAFYLRRNTLHNFTCPYDQDVVLFVFAPDSGTGPTDEVNPLKIRTYIGQQRYSR